MKEEWRSVVGWPTYEISNLGRLRSLMCSHGRGGLTARQEPRVCKLRPASNGYLRYRLQERRSSRSAPVHHLVLEAFRGQRPDGTEAAHLNGDRADNRVENLEWVTHVANASHMVAHGSLACGDANGNAILTAGRVEAARMLCGRGLSRAAVGRLLNVPPGVIENIMAGRTWKRLPPGYAIADAYGVLLALLREASSDALVHVVPRNGLWIVVSSRPLHPGLPGHDEAEAEAIAAALIALAGTLQ